MKPAKATSAHTNCANQDTPVPYSLSPLAFEDFYDIAAHTLTPAGLAELATCPDGLSLTGETVKSNLTAFLLAYQERQNARGAEACIAAMAIEERTALSLAWSILNELGLL